MGTIVWILITVAVGLALALAVAAARTAIRLPKNGYSAPMTDKDDDSGAQAQPTDQPPSPHAVPVTPDADETDERKDKDSIPHAGGLTESQKKEKAAKEALKPENNPAAHAGDLSDDPSS